MKHFKLILLALIMVLPLSLFAQDATQSGFSIESLLTALTPLIVLGVTQFTKWLLPKVPGIVVIIIVTVWSSVIAWVDTLVNSGGSWLEQFLYGMLAIVVHQIAVQLGKSKSTN